MSVLITGRLVSPTATELDHDPSHARVPTQAPRDNGGDGSSFSPTDLCAASLGSCAATTLSLFATRSKIPLTGVTFSVEKHMTAEPPRRIARLVLKLTIDSACGDEDYQKLVNAAKTCPVRRSLHPDIVVDETYVRA
jgi:putative redox protein